MIKNKRGIQISITFLVVIIVTVILFGIALYFSGLIFSTGQSIGESIDRRTADQIEYLVKSENAIVAIPFNVHETDLGDFAVFGVGIRNIGEDAEFGIVARFQGAYRFDGRQILTADPAFIEEEWLGNNQDIEPFLIAKSEFESYGLAIKAADRISNQHSTEDGDYAFNICVYDKARGKPSCILDSLSTESSLLYPPGKIYTATVRVQ